jgi:hypothetical protein
MSRSPKPRVYPAGHQLRLLPRGVHILPFLSEQDQLMVVSIGPSPAPGRQPNVFRGMAAIENIAGGWSLEFRNKNWESVVFKSRPTFLPIDGASPLGADNMHLLPRGVHRAPWLRVGRQPEWLAIDGSHRLVRTACGPHLFDGRVAEHAVEAQRVVAELQMLLDAIAPDEEARDIA